MPNNFSKRACLGAPFLLHETLGCPIANDSIVAFQFYDRMQQCLEHVTSNLNGLSNIVENPNLLYNSVEWKNLQNMIRDRYTMESEKAMFDAILGGKSIDEAIAIAADYEAEDEKDNEIELF
jgi:hypothetical protein